MIWEAQVLIVSKSNFILFSEIAKITAHLWELLL